MTSSADLLLFHHQPFPLSQQLSSLSSLAPFPDRSTNIVRIARSDFRGRCRSGVSHSGPPLRPYAEEALNTKEEIKLSSSVLLSNKIRKLILSAKEKLRLIDDGNLSVSAYDTAWVAMVKDIHGRDGPQFPSSLQWIVDNQLPDGSWGDHYFFSAYDRLLCTLACVVALKTWNTCPERCHKGIIFLQQNMIKLKDEDPEHQLSGFEVVFPTLIEMAQQLGLEGLNDSTVLPDLYAKREKKLKKIPMEILHNVPTTLLHSLEGIPNLNWEKLLKLQHPNGSFLCSTSSTAYALMQTKDEKCFGYLNQIVERFNGGVPHSYPMDLFERLWVVDRLERLGFSRYFQSEIKELLDYVYSYWTPDGISWSRNTIELDIDDTAMGFRMLRLHGYDVNADAFHHFEREGQFYCFVGQTNQGLTEMLSLHRASQILFPGEEILEEASAFASKTLRKKREMGIISDRWLITKDLPGEVQYYLDIPWYASLPRIETRYYIDAYGGDDDVWIAKVLYRMYNVSNNLFLELAKADYNHCQKMHQKEWLDIQKWYEELNLSDFGLSKDDLLKAYFLAMSSLFEPEKETERLAWSQTATMINVISVQFRTMSIEQKRSFVRSFINTNNHSNGRVVIANGYGTQLVDAILHSLSNISLKVQEAHGKEVDRDLKFVWGKWLSSLVYKTDDLLVPNEAEVLVETINLCSGHVSSVDVAFQPEYVHLTNLVNEICNRLHQKAGRKKTSLEENCGIILPTDAVQLQMQELMQILCDYRLDREIKRTFLSVAKSYYYNAYCDPSTIDLHVRQVLFEQIL